MPPTTQDSTRAWASVGLERIEQMLDADGLTIISPMQPAVEHQVKIAIEAREDRRPNLVVILDALGGLSRSLSGLSACFDTTTRRSGS